MNTAQEIMAAARDLHDKRFQTRNQMLKDRSDERFNRTVVEIPAAYAKTVNQPKSNILDDEGRQVATLIYAIPTPHLTPPSPEFQEQTTKVEQFLISMHQELEERNGPVWWQCTLAQCHDNLGWIYFAPKKVAYKGQPKSPRATGDDYEDAVKTAEWGVKNDTYKREAGISAVFDYEYAVTGTVLYEGNVYDPRCLYIWKEMPESSLKKKYGVQRKSDGGFEPVVPGQAGGYMPNQTTTETMVTVVEYWDAEECMIVAETSRSTWMGARNVKEAYELQTWKHNFGRVPYFARPAFPTDQLDEDKKFSGPLDGLYAEMARYKRLLAKLEAVSYQTAFSPLQVLTDKEGDLILDEKTNNAKDFLELEPGKARQMAPGQRIDVVPQSPEVANLYAEIANCRQEIERYLLSPVSKGVSPGADTANAALSNLHRFQLSTLDPMAQQESHQGRAIYRFALECVRKMTETVYVLDREADAYLSLSAADIISINVQAKAVPDQGQQQLLIEKHAMEMWQMRFWDKKKAYESTGIENPEELARAVDVEDYATTLKPVILQQVTTLFGMTDAINQMMQANAQGGSAADAIPGLMQQASGMQEGQMTGMGSGSGGQPRTPGTRMPTEDVNTAPEVPVG